MMLAKVPFALKLLLPKRIWNLSREEKVIYLSFDDGPIPEVTPWVLAELQRYGARATFFCIGDNVQKHPEVFSQILAEGHAVGNHTFNHLNGWKTRAGTYIENVEKAQQLLQVSGKNSTPEVKLFRPPYGRITEKQARLLRSRGFEIVMWEVLSIDYNQSLASKKCYRNVVKNSLAGSIVVFHDSLKAEKNLKEVLPRVLDHYSKLGFEFRALSKENLKV